MVRQSGNLGKPSHRVSGSGHALHLSSRHPTSFDVDDGLGDGEGESAMNRSDGPTWYVVVW